MLEHEDTIPLVARAHGYGAQTALLDDAGELSYAGLLTRSERAASLLLAGERDLDGTRVAFLTPPGIDHVIVQWAIWRAGGIAVPLCTTHPAPELEYVVSDADAAIIVAHPEFHARLRPIAERRAARWLSTGEVDPAALDSIDRHALPRVSAERGAMLLYTSGTTGKPKGVLSTHAILAAQMQSIAEAWEFRPHDRVLHVLPLHHLHGILNLLCTSLWSGASCEFLPRFDPERVWQRMVASTELTLFMAVPAIYAKLTQVFDQASPELRRQMRAGCERLRLMVSGSAALPAQVLERWREVSGHTLLERYGMTEFGMGLGNPLHGERRPGCVGVPFPGVAVRLCDEHAGVVADGESGEIQVQSAGVFAGYWRRPDATREALTGDGWFRSGDVAVRERGVYRILGRQSLDILKTGGFKVSALEIEEVLREHPLVRECAIVGIPDELWGQRVAAVGVLNVGADLQLDALRDWGKQRLAPYKVPSLLRVVSELPRNAMGKVQKTELAGCFE